MDVFAPVDACLGLPGSSALSEGNLLGPCRSPSAVRHVSCARQWTGAPAVYLASYLIFDVRLCCEAVCWRYVAPPSHNARRDHRVLHAGSKRVIVACTL